MGTQHLFRFKYPPMLTLIHLYLTSVSSSTINIYQKIKNKTILEMLKSSPSALYEVLVVNLQVSVWNNPKDYSNTNKFIQNILK